MNRAWALSKVNEFVDLLRRSNAQWRIDAESMRGHGPEWPELESRIARSVLTIEKIAREVEPGVCEGLLIRNGGYAWPHTDQLRSAELLLGVLHDQDELATNLGPQGPKLALSRMHPWIWHAAALLWDDGHHTQAVATAASSIFDIRLPAKLGEAKGTEVEGMVSKAFGGEHPRLVLPDYVEGTKDWTNAHQGAQNLGLACSKLVRNLRTHSATEEAAEDVLLEELAMLSRFARLVDEAKPRTAN